MGSNSHLTYLARTAGESRGAATCRHLVMIPLGEFVTSDEAVRGIARLQQYGSLQIAAAMLVERHDAFRPVMALRASAGSQVDDGAFASLLVDILGTGSDPGHRVSESFVTELRELSEEAGGWLAVIASGLDVGAAVKEFRRYPHVRLVYGRLAPDALDGQPGSGSR